MKRYLRVIAMVFSALVAVVIGVALSTPLWINEGAVKREIAEQVSRATGDSVDLDRIEIRFFPLRRVVISGLTYSKPGMLEMQAQSAAVSLDWWALLAGRVQTRDVNLSGVRISVRLPVGGPETKAVSEPLFLDLADRRLRQLVGQFTAGRPNLRVTIDDARVEVLIGDHPPLELQAARARLGVSAGNIDVEFACSSNLWEKLALAFTLSAADLGGAGRAEIIGLQTSRLNSLLGLALDSPSAEATVIARIDWRMQGLKNLNADFIASAPQVTVLRGTNWHAFSGVVIAAGFQTRGRALEANLNRLYLRSPHLMASGKLARHESGDYSLEGNAAGIDIDELMAAARDIAPEMPWIAQPPVAIRGGTVAALRIGSHADAASELLRRDLLQLEAAVEGVGFDFARKGIRIRDVSGRLSIEGGKLRVQNLTARLGKSVLRNARLATDFLSEHLRLSAEAELAADLAESLVLARQLLPDTELRSRLDELEQFEGKALVRLALQGSLKAPTLRFDVAEMNLNARHRAVPLPIRVSRGQAAYTGDAVSLHAVDGNVGESQFTGLDASVSVQPPHRFSVRNEHATLSSAELLGWAAALPQFGKTLAPLKRVSGTIELSASRAEGSLRKPEDWLFRIIATPRGLTVHAPDFGPELKLDGGTVELSRLEAGVKGVGVALMDAAFRVSAHAADYRKRITELDASANGKLGAEALAWIYQSAKIPRALQMRAPIEVSDAALTLSGRNDIRFKGRFRIAGGPVLGVEGRRTAKTWEIGKVTVKDTLSDASFGGRLADRNAKGWFKGRLFGETLAHTFVEPALSVGELKGDFVAAADLEKLKHLTAQGRLEGSGIKLATLLPVPVEAQRFAISADGARITVSEARLSSGDSQVEVVGTLERRANKFTLDADVRSERIVVPKLASASGSERTDRLLKIPLAELPIDGRIGVNVKHLAIGDLEISPLLAGATLADAKLDLDISDAAICGINLAGGLSGDKGNIKMNASLKASNAELDRSITCLTGAHLQASGRIDLDAKFTTQGTLDTLEESLRGTFSATARNGKLIKMDAINKAFALLNSTEAVRGKPLEIAPGGLPYRTMSARGSLDGKLIHFDEAMLDAPAVRIVAAGNVDINTYKLSIDAMVAPLQTATTILDRFPLLGRIFGGSVLAVPVQISGTLKNPIVVPLGPGAVVKRFTDIIGNTLKLPVDAITIIAPSTASPGASTPGKDLN
ncbi:MAG: hypothetical protein ACT4PQ_04915 [Betaproteobacteria bacterium]